MTVYHTYTCNKKLGMLLHKRDSISCETVVIRAQDNSSARGRLIGRITESSELDFKTIVMSTVYRILIVDLHVDRI